VVSSRQEGARVRAKSACCFSAAKPCRARARSSSSEMARRSVQSPPTTPRSKAAASAAASKPERRPVSTGRVVSGQENRSTPTADSLLAEREFKTRAALAKTWLQRRRDHPQHENGMEQGDQCIATNDELKGKK